MLKARDLNDVHTLFELSIHKEVYPYIRHQANTLDKFYFLTKNLIEKEETGLLISRTILNEFGQAIGTISLFDIDQDSGFLATWIGKPYFGMGYNKTAKQLFLNELFTQYSIKQVFIKVRYQNYRSLKALTKLPYVVDASFHFPNIHDSIDSNKYHLFVITKENYLSYLQFSQKAPKLQEEIVS